MLELILLQAGPAGMGYGNFILIGAMVLIFYFFMIRPQQKKVKEQKKFLEAIKKGDNVVTIGGMHGKVVSVDNDSITLEVDKATKIKFDKTAISLDSSRRFVKADPFKESVKEPENE